MAIEDYLLHQTKLMSHERKVWLHGDYIWDIYKVTGTISHMQGLLSWEHVSYWYPIGTV